MITGWMIQIWILKPVMDVFTNSQALRDVCWRGFTRFVCQYTISKYFKCSKDVGWRSTWTPGPVSSTQAVIGVQTVLETAHICSRHESNNTTNAAEHEWAWLSSKLIKWIPSSSLSRCHSINGIFRMGLSLGMRLARIRLYNRLNKSTYTNKIRQPHPYECFPATQKCLIGTSDSHSHGVEIFNGISWQQRQRHRQQRRQVSAGWVPQKLLAALILSFLLFVKIIHLKWWRLFFLLWAHV